MVFSSVYPLKINIYDNCKNCIYQSVIYAKKNICLKTKSKYIAVTITYNNATEIRYLTYNCNSICWRYRPSQSTQSDLFVQTFTLSDANYGIPITARLNFESEGK